MIAVNTSFRAAPWADATYACDGQWWRTYGAEQQICPGERWTMDPPMAAEMGLSLIRGVEGVGLSTRTDRVHTGGNSGYQAIGLAYAWGAARIVLLGFDMQRTGGLNHWHPDHPKAMGNLGDMAAWRARFLPLARDLAAAGVDVINATRQTALEAFDRQPLPEALALPDPVVAAPPIAPVDRSGPVVLRGMLGLGDNVHQRAVVRHLLRTRDVWLETPWPVLYHDLVDEGLHLLPPTTSLRTQAKNARRERLAYTRTRPPTTAAESRIWYTHPDIRAAGGFMAAMARPYGVPAPDFSLPIPAAWRAKADAWLREWQPDRPLMLYRPLVERTEWNGCAARNPDHEAYHALATTAAAGHFVVSVADLQPGVEWAVGRRIAADVQMHEGQLDVETIAALAAVAGVVVCSPGFLLVLAQAVGAPVVGVFGGHEAGRLYDHGDPRHLLIDPVRPCECFSKSHACAKAIDIPAATRRIQEFIRNASAENPALAA